MITEVKISEFMNTKLLVLHPKDSIQDAKDIFDKYKIHHIPIAINCKLVGILSLGDMLAAEKVHQHRHQDKFPETNSISMRTVDEIMTPNPYYILETDSLSKALDIMIQKRVNCLPVVSGNTLTGIVTTFDLIKLLGRQIETPCQ